MHKQFGADANVRPSGDDRTGRDLREVDSKQLISDVVDNGEDDNHLLVSDDVSEDHGYVDHGYSTGSGLGRRGERIGKDFVEPGELREPNTLDRPEFGHHGSNELCELNRPEFAGLEPNRLGKPNTVNRPDFENFRLASCDYPRSLATTERDGSTTSERLQRFSDKKNILSSSQIESLREDYGSATGRSSASIGSAAKFRRHLVDSPEKYLFPVNEGSSASGGTPAKRTNTPCGIPAGVVSKQRSRPDTNYSFPETSFSASSSNAMTAEETEDGGVVWLKAANARNGEEGKLEEAERMEEAKSKEVRSIAELRCMLQGCETHSEGLDPLHVSTDSDVFPLRVCNNNNSPLYIGAGLDAKRTGSLLQRDSSSSTSTENQQSSEARPLGDPVPPSPDIARSDLLHRLGLLMDDCQQRLPSPSWGNTPGSGCTAGSRYPRSISSPNMRLFRAGAASNVPNPLRNACATSPLSSPGDSAEWCNSSTGCSGSAAEDYASPSHHRLPRAPLLTMTYNPTFLPGNGGAANGRTNSGPNSHDHSAESVTSLISTSTGNSISPQSTWQAGGPVGPGLGVANGNRANNGHGREEESGRSRRLHGNLWKAAGEIGNGGKGAGGATGSRDRGQPPGLLLRPHSVNPTMTPPSSAGADDHPSQGGLGGLRGGGGARYRVSDGGGAGRAGLVRVGGDGVGDGGGERRGGGGKGGALYRSPGGGAGGRDSVDSSRRSARAFLGKVGTSQSVDFTGKGRFASMRQPPSATPVQLHLTRIIFEIPHPETSWAWPGGVAGGLGNRLYPARRPVLFVGRDWLFKEIVESLRLDASATSSFSALSERRGVVIVGGAGTGKTSIVERLVEKSSFGDQFNDMNHTIESPGHGLVDKTSSATFDALTMLANRVVAYHYCQADNNITCTIPEFVHSIAAHMVTSPLLRAYRDQLRTDSRLRAQLSVSACLTDPSRAFVRGILEPIAEIKQQRAQHCSLGKTESLSDVYIILVDALNEAAFHEGDYGGTIASFLAAHTQHFPSCLRIITTVRTSACQDSAITRLPYRRISLDICDSLSGPGEDGPAKDLLDYSSVRINSAPAIRDKISSSLSAQLSPYLSQSSRGSMLYVKSVLDLVENGPLIPTVSNFHLIPSTLSDIFLLHFNVRFQTARSFDQASVILNICLASLYPLTALEIYECLNAGLVSCSPARWEDFTERLHALDGLLVQRMDTTYQFFHPTFREWLIRRDVNESTKYLCDLRRVLSTLVVSLIRQQKSATRSYALLGQCELSESKLQGHALLALKLTRRDAPLSSERLIELGHHVLKAHIYRGGAGGGVVATSVGGGPREPGGKVSARDLQAYWLCLSADSLSSALVCQRHLYSPNVKVSRLILLAGASANSRTDEPTSPGSPAAGTPILCVASGEGQTEMVSVLLEFGADVNATGEDGVPALSHAAQRGHIKVIHLLISKLAKVNQMDYSNRCPLIHAAANGQLDAASFLLQCDWTTSRDRRPNRNEALQQSLISAAAAGHTAICTFLLSLRQAAGGGFDIDRVDSLLGETALTAACTHGRPDTVSTLLLHGADVTTPNSRGQRPLTCAASAGHRTVVQELVVRGGATPDQVDGKRCRTALMLAASEGHRTVVQLLLEAGASVDVADRDGLTALSWASLKGQISCAELLVAHGSSLQIADKNGRTPLDLAAFCGDERIVEFLLEHGALAEHEDCTGLRPLDRAISAHNIPVVIAFLRRGAKLGPSTWAMAAGKTDIIILLMNKLIDDGNVLYKKNRIKDAAYRYQYALKKIPEERGDGRGTGMGGTLNPDERILRELKVNLLLNLSRCKRKLNDTQCAIDLATAALELKPKLYEAYYARARALKDDGQYSSALSDLTEALKFAPNNGEIRRLIARVKEEGRDASTLPSLPTCQSNSDSLTSLALPSPRTQLQSGRGAYAEHGYNNNRVPEIFCENNDISKSPPANNCILENPHDTCSTEETQNGSSSFGDISNTNNGVGRFMRESNGCVENQHRNDDTPEIQHGNNGVLEIQRGQNGNGVGEIPDIVPMTTSTVSMTIHDKSEIFLEARKQETAL